MERLTTISILRPTLQSALLLLILTSNTFAEVPRMPTAIAVPPSDPRKGGVYDVRSAAKGYERW